MVRICKDAWSDKIARRAGGGQVHKQQQTYCDLGLRKDAAAGPCTVPGSSHSVRWALQATARCSASCVHMEIDTAWAADVLRAIGSAWAHTTTTGRVGRQMAECWVPWCHARRIALVCTAIRTITTRRPGEGTCHGPQRRERTVLAAAMAQVQPAVPTDGL